LAKYYFQPSTTTTLTYAISTNNTDVFEDSVLEKTIIGVAGAFTSAFSSYVFICIFKCIRNNEHLKVCSLIIVRKT